MRLPVVWLSEARAEFKDAKNRYTAIDSYLGKRFSDAIKLGVRMAQRNPQGYAELHRGVRRINLREFPYGLFFRQEPDRLLIVACLHAKRDPRHWQSR